MQGISVPIVALVLSVSFILSLSCSPVYVEPTPEPTATLTDEQEVIRIIESATQAPRPKPWEMTPSLTPWATIVSISTPTPRATTVYSSSTPIPSNTSTSLYREMAEAHIETGGSGQIPELSRRIGVLLSGISSACNISEHQVATLSLAGQLSLWASDVQISLLGFM